MNAQSGPCDERPSLLQSRWLGLALLALAAMLIWSRWHTYDEAIDTDVANFAVVARGLLEGRQLYSDLFDLKPPLIYGIFAGAQILVGSGPAQLFLLGCGFGLLTLAGVYCAGTAMHRQPAAGLFAALIYVLLNNNVQTWSSQVFAEYFEAAGLVWSFVFSLRLLRSPTTTRWSILLGFAIAASTLIKHPVVIYWAVTGPVLILLAPREQRREMLRQILLASAIIAAVWATVLLYFALQDRLRDMWDAMVVMNGHNAGLSVVSNLSMLFSRWWVGFYLEHTLLVAPAIGLALGALLARGSRDRRAWMLLLGSLAAVAAVVTLPVRPFHYYLHLWLPFLAVGCGWTWHVLTAFRSRCRFVPELALGSIVLAALWVQVPWFRQPASAWSEFRRGSILNETHQLGLDINRLLRPDETFYMWGGETGLYFASQRLPPTGFINTDSVESGPIAGRLSQRLQAQLLAHPPELLVLLIPNLRIPSDPECRKVWSWFTQHYGIMPTTGLKGSYLLCCRIGGSLERRTGTARPLNEQLRVQMPDGSSQQAR